MKLTENQINVLTFLLHSGEATATTIGEKVGKRAPSGKWRDSTWAYPILKRLISLGLVYRSDAVYFINKASSEIQEIQEIIGEQRG